MNKCIALSVVAGLAASGSMSGAALGQVSCGVMNTWVWSGPGTDVFDPANWFDCGMAGTPPLGMPVYFGPVERTVDGVSSIEIPSPLAVIDADLASPALRIANGLDFSLFVLDAVYSVNGSAVVGDLLPVPFPAGGTSELVLDNALFDGGVLLGRSGGRGRLVLRNNAAVTGGISFSGSFAEIVNETVFSPVGSLNNTSTGDIEWRNTPGSVLDLGNVSFSRSFGGLAGLVFEPGSVLRQTGSGSSVAWDVDMAGTVEVLGGTLTVSGAFDASAGAVDVVDGTLRLSGPMSGDATVVTSPTGLFDAAGSLPADFDVDVIGNLGLGQLVGDGTLTVSGDMDVTSAGLIGGSIVNTGDMMLLASPNNSSQGPALWRNVSGSTLELATGSFSRSFAEPAELVFEQGSLLRNAGMSNVSIAWDVETAGTIEVEAGFMNVSGAFDSASAVAVVLDGTLRLGGPLSGDLVATTGATGVLDVAGVLSDDFDVDLMGNLGIGTAAGAGTLTLTGVMDVTSAGFIAGSIVNAGDMTLRSSPNNSSQGPALWRNVSGSTLELASGSFSRSFGESAELVFEQGSLLRKAGTSNGSIAWDVETAGTIEVEAGFLSISGAFDSISAVADVTDGTLQVSGPLSGDLSATTGATGLLDVAGVLADDFNVDLIGNLGIATAAGSGSLVLTGDMNVTSAGLIAGSIVNAGAMTLQSSPNNSSQSPALWRNVSGSTLEVVGGSFSRSFAEPAELVFDPGSVLLKTSVSSVSVGWDVTAASLFDIAEGTLTLSAGIDGSIDLMTGPTGVLSLTGRFGPGVVITGAGTLGLSPQSVADEILLGGDFDLTAGLLLGEVRNEGRVRLINSVNNSSQGSLNFRNVDGSVLEIETVSLNKSFAPSAALTIETGAELVKLGPSSVSIAWDVENAGTIDVRDGVLTITDSEPQMTEQSSMLTGNGTLSLSQAEALLNKGTIAPGLSTDADPDGLRIDVDFLQNADTAVFRVQAGIEAGKLTVDGIFDISGTLEVQRFGDFEPDGTEEFVILEAGFSTGAFGNFFTNAVPVQGQVAHDVVTGDLQFDVVYTPTSVVIRNLSVFVPPCNLADLAGPGGVLDLADVDAFITLFLAGDPSIDLVPTFGVLDLADIDAFITSFLAGCP